MYKKLKKRALLSIVSVVLAAAVFCTCGCVFKADAEDDEPRDGLLTPCPQDTADTAADKTAAAYQAEHSSAGAFREATLYYVSDEGYVVPVKKLIPWEEGIAKACLGYITSSPANDREAARLGLNTVLPEGTRVELSIQEGTAVVDLSHLEPLASAEEERAMIAAVVDTLTEFSTVDRVTITREGEGGTLENGTELPKNQKRYPLNIEAGEIETSASVVPGTLYFPNLSGAVTVPVTRYFGSEPSLYAKAAALIAGPKAGDLMCCFPQGTLLLGAAIENGVLTVNLSEDFKAVEKTYGMYTLAYKTLLFTMKEEFDFDKLIIQVNGTVYAPELAAGR